MTSGPKFSEEIKYGGILSTSCTGFCGVFAYQNHATIEFSEGSQLPDPHGVLTGKGKSRRHIRIDAEHIEEYVAARARGDGRL